MPKTKNNSVDLKHCLKPRKKIAQSQQKSIRAKPQKACNKLIQFDQNEQCNPKINAKEILHGVEEPKDVMAKLYEVTNCLLKTRGESSSKLLESLVDVINQIEGDCNILHDNEQKLELLTSTMSKCTPPTTLKALKDVYESFKKESNELDYNYKSEIEQLADELDKYIEGIKSKVISETKRSGLDVLRRSIFQAYQNYF